MPGSTCCISFDSYIKPQLCTFLIILIVSCISFDSYIKPQHILKGIKKDNVVYLLIPTSNHNILDEQEHNIRLYIFWFLHQTTTRWCSMRMILCCISFDSYIKPQRPSFKVWWCLGCISFDSYIKPQHDVPRTNSYEVVYLLIPTSNHNYFVLFWGCFQLYIFWFLHQTTTSLTTIIICHTLYIFWFLHQTTTAFSFEVSAIVLYIFWFLHQTTTKDGCPSYVLSCISFDSYIKPQLNIQLLIEPEVVYLLIPTSNHNC